MKKVINNKLYNTETAECLGSYSNGYDPRKFDWYKESLYRKQTGEFFLHGTGGPLTAYASKSVDGRGSGELIIPLIEDKAMEWAADNLTGEEYCEIFGEPEE